MKYSRRVDGRRNGGCVRQRLYPAKSVNSESMFAFQFAVIHIRRSIEISVRMNDTMARDESRVIY
jgi:hypothetical protein